MARGSKRTLSIVVSVLLLTTAAGMLARHAGAAGANSLIVVNQSMAGVSLSATANRAIATLGQPTNLHLEHPSPGYGILTLTWKARGLLIRFGQVPHYQGDFAYEFISTGSLRTGNGISVGSTSAQLHAAYPQHCAASVDYCVIEMGHGPNAGFLTTSFFIRHGRVARIDMLNEVG